MEHISYSPNLVFLVVFVVLGAVFFGALGMVGYARSNGKKVRRSLVTASVTAAAAFVTLAVTAPFSPANVWADWKTEVADAVGSHYGIALSADDIGELDYPLYDKGDHDDVKSFGTISLDGRAVTLFREGDAFSLRHMGEELSVAG